MDLLIEILFEVYGELMMLIIPEKGKGLKYRIIAKIVAVVVMLGVIALALWGLVLIFEYGKPIGIAPLAIATVISLVQIIAGIILFKKHHG